MFIDAGRMHATTRWMSVAERSVVMPDGANIIRVSFEEELWRGVDTLGYRTTDRTICRFSGFLRRSFDVEVFRTRRTLISISSHRLAFPPGVFRRPPNAASVCYDYGPMMGDADCPS